MVSHGPYEAGQRGTVDYPRDVGRLRRPPGLPAVHSICRTLPSNWDEAGKKQWQAAVADAMRPYRNHPSVVMWATNPNRFGIAGMDLDPRYMGRQRGIPDPGLQEGRGHGP